jgi:ABC-type proline/glycine betaine transport system permease subunit
VLAKVKIPLARNGIMLGVDQASSWCSPRWSSAGSWAWVRSAMRSPRGLQRNEFGEGVVASLAILALGIALDRVSQGTRRKREERAR